MFIKRILLLTTVWLMSLTTIATADFFAPEESEDPATEIVSDEAGEVNTPATKEYVSYQETLFTTSPGVDHVLGSKNGYIHPFLSLGGYYTDNLFNVREKEESDWISVISPGIWVALPASRQQLVQITTLNTAPGGLEVSRFRTRSEKRFQGYALYRAGIYEFADNDDQNHVNQRAEALLEYNMPGGLSFELLNIYEIDHDDYNIGDSGPTDLDKFHSNLFNPTVSYRVGPRLTLSADYRYYTLDYNSDRNDDEDRDDKVYSVYAFYKLTPKLSALIQYEHIDTDYDEDIVIDSEEDNFYGGIQWRATAKTSGWIKLGYGEKDYDDSNSNSNDEFLAEAKLDHRFTPKTSMYFRAVRKQYASDVSGSRDVLAHRFHLGYSQKFRPKWLGRAQLEYVRNEYDGKTTVGPQTNDREDDNYGFRAEIGFAMRKWLNLSIGYTLKKRDSNFNNNDYTNNSVFLFMTTSL